MILIINTADSEKVIIGLANNLGLLKKKQFNAKYQQSEKLLPAITKLLASAKVSLKDLRGVIVVIGPGPFTALRVGVVTANTLAYSLQVPNIGFKLDQFDTLDDLALKGMVQLRKLSKFRLLNPFYAKEPNITKPRRD